MAGKSSTNNEDKDLEDYVTDDDKAVRTPGGLLFSNHGEGKILNVKGVKKVCL